MSSHAGRRRRRRRDCCLSEWNQQQLQAAPPPSRLCSSDSSSCTLCFRLTRRRQEQKPASRDLDLAFLRLFSSSKWASVIRPLLLKCEIFPLKSRKLQGVNVRKKDQERIKETLNQAAACRPWWRPVQMKSAQQVMWPHQQWLHCTLAVTDGRPTSRSKPARGFSFSSHQ